MKCELCDGDFDSVERCGVCETKFCKNCGDVNRNLCNDCIEFDDASDGDLSDLNE